MKQISFFTTFMLLFAIHTIAQSDYPGKLGYGVSPEGHPYDFTKFGDFLQEVADMCNGGVVFANAAWRDNAATSGQIPTLQKVISLLQPSSYNYTDMINFGWRSGDTLLLSVPDDTLNNWSNDTTKRLFLQMLINAADSLQPAYLFMGNEISFYWEMDSTDYLNWVNFYNEAYDSIKAHSPNTKVGTVFNFEHLAGVGVLTGFDTAYWGAFDVVDTSKIDILGLTVYPFFSYKTANEVPLNYLDSIFNRMGNKALAFTETGWPADSFIGSWTSSPEQQVDYVNKLFEIIDGHNVEVVNWLFLNYSLDTTDTEADRIFRSVAMRDSRGNDRPALPVWLSYCDTTAGINDVIDNNNSFALYQNYPNPFNPVTSISFSLPRSGFVTLKVFNLLGEEVTTLISQKLTEGKYTIQWNPTDIASGIYLYRLQIGEFVETKKLILLR